MNPVIARLGLSTLFAWISTSAMAAPDQGGLGGALQREIEKQIPPVITLPSPGPEVSSPQLPKEETSDVKVTVSRFDVRNSTMFSELQLQEILSPWIGKPLTMAELQDAADAIAKLYLQRGMLARTAFPPQKIGEDGIVVVQVVEAKLGQIKFDSGAEPGRFNQDKAAAYFAEKNTSGELINTKKIEQALLLLGELPGVEIKTELRPSEDEGSVDLFVTLLDKPLLSGSMTLGNQGNASTGKQQALLSANLSSPTGNGDLVSFNAIGSQGLTYAKVGWYWPVGFNGAKLGIDYSGMTYKTVGRFAGNMGDAETYSVNLTYPVLRSTATNLNASVSHESKFYKNYHLAEGQADKLVISDYEVKNSTFTFSGNHYDTFGLGGVTNFSLGVIHGHWGSNTWSDSNSPNNYGQYNKSVFNKLSFLVSRSQQLAENERILIASLSGQLSSGMLDSVERFYLGGPNGVRAYPSAQGSGDQGMLLTLQLQQQLDDGVVGYGFFDYGVVQQYKDKNLYALMVPPNSNTTRASNGYHLSGAGFGAKFTQAGIEFNGSMAWPIGSNPLFGYNAGAQAYVQQNSDGRSKQPYLWVQASLKF